MVEKVIQPQVVGRQPEGEIIETRSPSLMPEPLRKLDLQQIERLTGQKPDEITQETIDKLTEQMELAEVRKG